MMLNVLFYDILEVICSAHYLGAMLHFAQYFGAILHCAQYLGAILHCAQCYVSGAQSFRSYFRGSTTFVISHLLEKFLIKHILNINIVTP